MTAGAVTASARPYATLHGTVNPNGLATTYQFQYGPTNALGSAVPATAASAGAGTAAVAESTSSPGYRRTPPTTTSSSQPTATAPQRLRSSRSRRPATRRRLSTTDPATGVGRNSATLVGTIAPNNQATTYLLRVRPDHSLRVPDGVKSIPAGSTPMAVTAALPGLEPGTVYHYRLVASHGSTSTTYGADMTFQTLPWPRPHTSARPVGAAQRPAVVSRVDGKGHDRARATHDGTARVPRHRDGPLLRRQPPAGDPQSAGRSELQLPHERPNPLLAPRPRMTVKGQLRRQHLPGARQPDRPAEAPMSSASGLSRARRPDHLGDDLRELASLPGDRRLARRVRDQSRVRDRLRVGDPERLGMLGIGRRRPRRPPRPVR